MQVNDTTVNEIKEVLAEQQVDTSAPQRQPSQILPSNKMMKKFRKQQKQQKKMIANYTKNVKTQNEKFQAKVERVKTAIGKENFTVLKDLYTSKIPYRNNEQNQKVYLKPEEEVKSEDSTIQYDHQTNWTGLFKEVTYLVATMREQRIKEGKRKRSSGRSSDRKRHSNIIEFLTKRNEQGLVEGVTKTYSAQAPE